MTAKTSITAKIDSGGTPSTPTAITFRYGGGGGSEEPKNQNPPQLPPDHFPCLPALRCLGNLNGVRPVLIVDTREKLPLPFHRLATERGTLLTADYSFAGGEELFAVERKTIQDLVGCCAGEERQRFFRELHRLRGYRFKRLLIIGSPAEIEAGEYVSKFSAKAVLATLGAIQARFDVPVVFCPSPEEGGRLVESWAYFFAREIVEQANTLARSAGLTRPGPATAPQTIAAP